MSLDTQAVFISCGYKHEEGFLQKDVEGVRDDIVKCVMRVGGNNLLCAHPTLRNDVGVIIPEARIERRVNNLFDQISEEERILLENKRVDARYAIEVLDDMVYVSHQGSRQRGYFYHGDMGIAGLIPNYDEIIGILERANLYVSKNGKRSLTKSDYSNMRNLNAGEQNRFNYLIKQAQSNIQKHYEEFIKELDRLET